jgi:hypothetical protein
MSLKARNEIFTISYGVWYVSCRYFATAKLNFLFKKVIFAAKFKGIAG